jgi:hypothetical protein
MRFTGFAAVALALLSPCTSAWSLELYELPDYRGRRVQVVGGDARRGCVPVKYSQSDSTSSVGSVMFESETWGWEVCEVAFYASVVCEYQLGSAADGKPLTVVLDDHEPNLSAFANRPTYYDIHCYGQTDEKPERKCRSASTCGTGWGGKCEDWCSSVGFSHMTGTGCFWPAKRCCCKR